MSHSYFGTDGVRGEFGGPVINPVFVRRLGAAVGRWMKSTRLDVPAGVAPCVLIGRDTRASGVALEAALAAGLAAEGLAPCSLGIIPTPAVSRAVRTHGAALGAVITASHNPACDNGIKFFGPTGAKLSEVEERAIEEQLGSDAVLAVGAGDDKVVPCMPDAAAEYMHAASLLLPKGALKGWRVVLDTANGATCATSPAVLRALGAEVVSLGTAPDGRNINEGVGSERPEALRGSVIANAARLGIAHDGDGDRCVLCDEKGMVLDGDEIMTVLAVHALRRGILPNNVLVLTVQSNLGVDVAVKAAGGRVVRTPVGDRHVGERMRAEGALLGGESSGHLIWTSASQTGDGLVAALKVIEVMLATGQPLSELRQVLRKYPQSTVALKVAEKRPLEQLFSVQTTIREIESELEGRGRVMVRYSGTESKIRLLVEDEDSARVESCLARLQIAVRADLPAG